MSRHTLLSHAQRWVCDHLWDTRSTLSPASSTRAGNLFPGPSRLGPPVLHHKEEMTGLDGSLWKHRRVSGEERTAKESIF